MASCTKCEALLDESAVFCRVCGTKRETLVLDQQDGGAKKQYYVSYATGGRVGPLGHDEVNRLIREQQIKISDSVCAVGEDRWMPITQSEFAELIAQSGSMERLAASTCPRCGAGMAVVLKRSRLGLVLIIIGLITTPLFGIGIPIFIVGFILRWGRKGKAAYQCPRCNYATA